METLWFWLVAMMLAGYVVLDGYDFGAGALHLILARGDKERTQVLESIGPFWDGNEVWLIAGGGTLYFAFPALYSSAFSGFYLPLMIVLWLLILRGIAIESRHFVQHPLWSAFWDVVFCGASALLAIMFGAALGNIVRGVPLDREGEFFLPLWTNFGVTGPPGILDWYTILVAIHALAVLLLHGALWLRYRTHPPLEGRAAAAARRLFVPVVVLTVAVTAGSIMVRPGLFQNYVSNPAGFLLPIAALGGFAVAWQAKGSLRAFLGSCLFIGGLLASVVFSLYPFVLPALPAPGQPDFSLTVSNAAAPPYGLRVGLMWWIPGFLLAGVYSWFSYSRFSGKVDKHAP